MDHQAQEWLGLVAGALTTFSFVPQVVRVWRTRHVADLSLATFALLTAGVALWLVYGLLIGSTPVVVANAITFFLASSILIAKLRFGRALP